MYCDRWYGCSWYLDDFEEDPGNAAAPEPQLLHIPGTLLVRTAPAARDPASVKVHEFLLIQQDVADFGQDREVTKCRLRGQILLGGQRRSKIGDGELFIR